ncbi:alpha/beta hydrolase [Burkholderia stagnalis]
MKSKKRSGALARGTLAAGAVALALAGCGGGDIDNAGMPTGPAPVANAAYGDGGMPAFYTWTSGVPTRPGLLLRQQALPSDLALDHSDAARNLRLLYTSTEGVDGKTPITVSGAVYLPQGTPPGGGWPIIAWTHGTVGIADICAQSFRQRSDRDKAYLGAMLAQGYAVVATDYEGLGTPGPHPYLVHRAEAYGALDAVRAALSALPGVLANKVVAVGQSQGSGATIATLQYASGYAPDVHVVGGVATGVYFPLVGPGAAPSPPVGSGDAGNSVYLLLAIRGTGTLVDPGFDFRPYVSDRALPIYDAATTSCLDALDAQQQANGVDQTNYLKASPPADKIGAIVTATSTQLAGFSLKVPLFTGSGLADTTTPPSNAYAFISTACSLGAPIEWHYYPGETHDSTVNASLVDSLPFIRKVMTGQPVTGNCAALQPPAAS